MDLHPNVHTSDCMIQLLNSISLLAQESFLKSSKRCCLEHPSGSPGRLSWTLSPTHVATVDCWVTPSIDTWAGSESWTKPRPPYRAAPPPASIDINASCLFPDPPFSLAPMSPKHRPGQEEPGPPGVGLHQGFVWGDHQPLGKEVQQCQCSGP